jgi:hypothetical protein
MPSVKGIGHSNFSSRPMEKRPSMNKLVVDHGNKPITIEINFILMII